MLLMLAGLQTIPAEQYEAASIDGANAWQRFRYRHVAEPALPARRRLHAGHHQHDPPLRHHRRDDRRRTGRRHRGLPVLLYNTAFRANRFGDAAAIGVALLVLVLAFAVVYVRLTRPDAWRRRERRRGRRAKDGGIVQRARILAGSSCCGRGAGGARRGAVSVLLDAEHVAEAAPRRCSRRRPRSCRRTGRSMHMRRCSQPGRSPATS